MWISKNADERKKDFMEAAARLFAEKGYEKTSINDIITAVGVTKGSFYHHFQSKEEVVDAIITSLAEGLVLRLHTAVEQDQPAAGKLMAIIAAVMGFRAERKSQYSGLYPILSREENHALSRRFQQAVEADALPVIANVVRQGNEEGAFRTPDATRTASLILRLSALVKADLAGRVFESHLNIQPDEIGADAAFWQDMMERLLGAAPGTLPVSVMITQMIENLKGAETHENH